jgi:hypothetical protein
VEGTRVGKGGRDEGGKKGKGSGWGEVGRVERGKRGQVKGGKRVKG